MIFLARSILTTQAEVVRAVSKKTKSILLNSKSSKFQGVRISGVRKRRVKKEFLRRRSAKLKTF